MPKSTAQITELIESTVTGLGYELQIDFGEKVVQLGGQMTRLHFFVCKLGYSRRLFAKAYPSETQTAWLDGLESAFRYFGGLPYCIVCDNASSLVRDHYAKTAVERFTERFYQFCTYYGLKPIATAVCKPRSKGKVESGVKYLKGNLELVVHSDNGASMKAAKTQGVLTHHGVKFSHSRPRVSNDNPYSESFFRTLKYNGDYLYPRDGFESLEHAQKWLDDFIEHYNEKHRHCGIRMVTPVSCACRPWRRYPSSPD